MIRNHNVLKIQRVEGKHSVLNSRRATKTYTSKRFGKYS
ncbi:hypothetical protein CPT_Muenster_456 [Klebsiella phage Muenster]|nr:hypothetical protein CPT_Muenster_456 [Klebsiella phage Muenster]